MTSWPVSSLALAGANFFVMVLWMVITYGNVETLRTGRSRGPISNLQPIVGMAVTAVYFTAGLFPLVPLAAENLSSDLVYLYLANDLAGFFGVAVFHHMSWYFRRDAGPPSRLWLAANYGVLALVILAAIFFPIGDLQGREGLVGAYGVVTWTYLFLMLAFSFRRAAWRARDTGWRAGSFGPAARPDLIILRIGLGLLVASLGIFIAGAWTSYQELLGWMLVVFGAIVGVPFAVRNLGAVIRDVLVTLGMVGISASWVGISWTISSGAEPAARGAMFALLLGAGLAVAFLFIQPGLWRLLDHTIFGRNHDQQAALQRALHRLSPELGTQACTERALSDLVAVLQIEGAALFLRDGGEIVEGHFEIEELAAVWPRGEVADSLLPRTLIGGELSELPSEWADARMDAGVVAVVDVRGSQRLWGHLLLTTDLVGASLREEDLRAIEAFGDQLGLLLDGASLLARAVGVERSLAHAEKLAVIGELTARVAHEIRNPATAARSLAQQLVGEGGPNSEELGIILAELERIERQVADLLQFGRRDDVELSSIDFGELATSTAQDLRASLRASGLELEVSVEDGIRGPGDPEKLRQVLINLVENARDALTESHTGRHVGISVRNGTGRVALEVSDDGPGVDDQTLSRLFEPFFSNKHEGTGLGLAIARRTIEAHGGRIEARRRPAGGMRFRIELPAHEAEEST